MRGAPKGNQFWKLRSKHGKEILFADAELLWKECCKYFQWRDDNPLIAIEFNGKDATECEVPKMRAYTLRGLCLFLGCNINYFTELKERIKKRKDAKSVALREMITRIEDTIWTQKFEGAAAGFLNANLITRDLGLVDKQALEAKVDANIKANVTGKVTVVHKQSGVPLGNTPTDGD